MSRPFRSKCLYLASVVVLGVGVLCAVYLIPYDKGIVIIVAGVLLLIPGRIQGAVFRDHYTGRRLQNAGDYLGAIEHSNKFLAEIRAKPWKKKFIWFAWGIYSWDVEAMTLNNLGSALMHIGQLEESEEALRNAIAIDKEYAIPYWNLAVLESMRANEPAAREYLSTAHSLGYRRTTIDQVIELGQAILARIEGRSS